MASYPALDLRFAAGPGAGTLQDMLYAELDAFEPVAIHEHESGDAWRVFFRTSAQRDDARRALAAEFENAIDLHAVDVEDEDWARRSQESLRAARAGRIIVAPPWDLPRDANRDVLVVIDPSTGFGTGHHPTTRLCLELLQEIDLTGKRVIDVGTGSGVLAIAAAKLGARDVIGIDNDPDALQNARENVQRNGVEIQVLEADLSAPGIPSANVVLANLTSAVLQRFAGSLRNLLVPEGILIASGFSPDDLNEIMAALGAIPQKVASDGDWAAASVLLSRRAAR